MQSSETLFISKTEPIPLVKDFDNFIDYLLTHKMVLTASNEYISGKDLFQINQQMSSPLQDVTTKTQQIYYPLLHLFYHLAEAGRLVQKSMEGKKLVFKPIDRIEMYKQLTPTEKYFFLLETLWIDANWEKVQAGYFRRSPIYSVNLVFEILSQKNKNKKIDLQNDNSFKNLSELFTDWEYFLHYFSFFGFWVASFRKDITDVKRFYMAATMTLTKLGCQLIPILKQTRPIVKWNLPILKKRFNEWDLLPFVLMSKDKLSEFFEGQEENNQEHWKTLAEKNAAEPFFQPFVHLFPEGQLKNTLPRSLGAFVDGTYVFKVAMSRDIWRRIEMAANHTLLDLHGAIQRAFKFDDDHLYSFFMDGKPWSDDCYCSPMDEKGPCVDEVRIGELELFEGKRFLYLFDYGDCWQFEVILEKIDSEKKQHKKPQIMKVQGKAPPQYGDFDE